METCPATRVVDVPRYRYEVEREGEVGLGLAEFAKHSVYRVECGINLFSDLRVARNKECQRMGLKPVPLNSRQTRKENTVADVIVKATSSSFMFPKEHKSVSE